MIIKKLAGISLIIFGVLQSVWIFYNLVIKLTETARAYSPGPAIFLSIACIILGLHKLTNGKLLEYDCWKNREFHKWIAAGLALLFLAYVVNMILRYRNLSAIEIKTIIEITVDCFSLYLTGKFFLTFLMNAIYMKTN